MYDEVIFPSKLICRYYIYKFIKSNDGKSRLIIGAASDRHKGWLSSDIPMPYRNYPDLIKKGRLPIDITIEKHWHRFFRNNSLSNILSEHVLEHLSDNQLNLAVRNFFKYVKPTGKIRIAVPDGNRKDRAYINKVSPPNDGHQQLFTIDTLTSLFENNGFKVKPLEYYDSNQNFFSTQYSESEGIIKRSSGRDRREEYSFKNNFYTSIIIDAIKP